MYAPTFRRDLEEPVAGAIAIAASTRLVITEGNYLLLEDGAWAGVRAALDEGKEEDLLCSRVEAGGSVLYRGYPSEWTLQQGNKTFSFSQRGGEWLEKLTAVAFAQAGANHVRARVRLRWNEHNEEAARKQAEIEAIRVGKEKADPVFSLDLDVVGSWGTSLFLVSCKSNPNSDIDSAAEEVLRTGANLGRFGLRMLAHMGCTKTYMHDSVLVLGWRELCQPKVLRDLFQELRERPRTVRE